MNISTLSPIVQLPAPTEASQLRSPRDSDSIYKQWQKVREVILQNNKIGQLINQMSREIKRLEERRTSDFEFFPFKIYSLPDELRPQTDSAQFTSSANWRTFRVRGGLVLTSYASTGSFVNGTDNFQNYSYYNFISGTVNNYDIQVPINTPQYWFWIEDSGSQNIPRGTSSFYLRYGANPAVSGAGNPNPWVAFPQITSAASGSINYIPVGYVDTNTSGSKNIAYVRQFVTSDILATGNSSASSSVSNVYKGTYNSAVSYSYLNEVRKLSGGSQGLWIYVAATGSAGNDPVWPEPISAGSSSNIWELKAFGPQQANNCNPTGSSVVYINSSLPLL